MPKHVLRSTAASAPLTPHAPSAACTAQVLQPFEDVLPYANFSRRVDFAAVPKIPELLSAVRRPDVVRMRRQLRQSRGAFAWEGAGATAYEHTLVSLCHRAGDGRW